MTNKTLLARETIQHVQLITDVCVSVNRYAQKYQQDFSWFRFAKRTPDEWLFLEKKEKQWKIVVTIVQEIATHYPEYTSGNIFDLLADHINTTIEDYMEKKHIQKRNDYTLEERHYIAMQLIAIGCLPTYIPHKPWLMAVKSLAPLQWQVKDLSTGSMFQMMKEKKNNFYEYFTLEEK